MGCLTGVILKNFILSSTAFGLSLALWNLTKLNLILVGPGVHKQMNQAITITKPTTDTPSKKFTNVRRRKNVNSFFELSMALSNLTYLNLILVGLQQNQKQIFNASRRKN